MSKEIGEIVKIGFIDGKYNEKWTSLSGKIIKKEIQTKSIMYQVKIENTKTVLTLFENELM